MRGRRPLLVLLLGAAVAACAAAVVPRTGSPSASADGGADAPGARGGDGASAESTDAGLDVAALAERLAPGMREIERLRLDLRDAGAYALAPTDVDRCYRIAIVSAEIVAATLTDDAGHVLATARGRSTALGAKGPVCLRKGQRATLEVPGATAIEVVVWTSP